MDSNVRLGDGSVLTKDAKHLVFRNNGMEVRVIVEDYEPDEDGHILVKIDPKERRRFGVTEEHCQLYCLPEHLYRPEIEL